MAQTRDLTQAVRKAKRVYIVGNGGSAANAIHMANDLVSCKVRAHALTADVATLTAIANDYGYENIFSMQVEVFGEPEDLLIALSGSGKSPNILKAIESAERIGMSVYKIFGSDRGEDMQAAENSQVVICHELMKELRASRAVG